MGEEVFSWVPGLRSCLTRHRRLSGLQSRRGRGCGLIKGNRKTSSTFPSASGVCQLRNDASHSWRSEALVVVENIPNGGAKGPPQISPRSHLLCSLLTGRCGRGGLVDFSVGAWAHGTLAGRCAVGVGTWRRQKVRPLLALLPQSYF